MAGIDLRIRGLRFARPHLRLTHKIAAIGVAGILGAALLGAIYLIGASSQESFTTGARDAQALYARASKLSGLLLESRRAEKDFLLTNDMQHANKQRELAKTIESEIETLRKEAAAAGKVEIAKAVEQIADGFHDYAMQFASVIEIRQRLGLKETEGLEGALRKAVHIVETRLKDFNDPSLTVTMLMMRRHEKDFMLRRDPKYGDDLAKRANEFSKAVAANPLMSPADQKDLNSKLSDYERNFNAWLEAANGLGRAQRAMQKAYIAIEPAIESMIKQVEASFNEMTALNEKAVDATTLRMQISIGLIISLLAIIAFFVGRSISRPLKTMTGAMGELANGNLDIALPGLDRKDEIGDMAVAVDRFRIRAAERAQQRAEDKRKEDERRAAEHRAAMTALADQFEGAVGAIVERVSQASIELEACSGALSQTAQTTQQLTMTVTAASEQASANVESVAGATEEMSSSVNEISRQVHESSRIANEAVAQASKTDNRIAELSQAATRIGDVVALITAIAEQTNLLALNATIEAARAGEAGRGFAVVASEVKQLASQTAKATEEIGTQVASMQTATSESVAAIKEIGGTIGRISEIATAIASAVEEQDSVTKDIARNVQQAAAGTSQVVEHIGEVNRGANETGSASANLLTSAQSLSGESNRLKSEVEKFLASVRAA
jgi:methyl-accepting chemotaxis protein